VKEKKNNVPIPNMATDRLTSFHQSRFAARLPRSGPVTRRCHPVSLSPRSPPEYLGPFFYALPPARGLACHHPRRPSAATCQALQRFMHGAGATCMSFVPLLSAPPHGPPAGRQRHLPLPVSFRAPFIPDSVVFGFAVHLPRIISGDTVPAPAKTTNRSKVVVRSQLSCGDYSLRLLTRVWPGRQ